MKKLALLLIFILTIFQGISQTKGISYQAVILNPEAQELPGVNAQGNILANTTVGIQFTIIDASGNQEYQESHTTSTDNYGMLNLLIGTGNPSSNTDFSEILWDGTTKKLKVSIDFSGGSNYSPLSEQNLTYMPQPPTEQVSTAIETNAEAIINETIRATAAEELNAIDLAAEVLRATTAEGVNATAISAETTRATSAEQNNATNISTLQTEQITQNTAITLNTAKTGITPAQAAIIAATSGTNTGDQDISGIATNATDISTLQAEQTTQNTAIALNTAKVGITAQQASDITANNAKVSDVNHVTSSTTDDLTEGITNLYYTESRVSANAAVAANTAKTGITSAQAAVIAATSGTNTGDQDISGIATNATDISTLQTEQTTQNTAIALNTAKVGITAQQASDITANNAKVSDVNHVASSTTDNLTEGTINLYYTEARVSANTDVAANTAKTGITPAQAAIIAATSGTNTGDQDITGIATNATDISTLQTEQTTQNTAIALNTAKVGITAQQASDITANNAKVSDVNHVTSSTTDDLTEGTTNLYYTEARVSANAAVAANTAKVGITPAQATAITANTAKVSDVNHVTTSTTDDLTEGTTNLYYTDARVSANATVAANTAKTGITPAQAAVIAATSGTNTGDQDISGIATNAAAISAIQTGGGASQTVSANVIQVSLAGTLSPTNAIPVDFTEILFSKGSDFMLNADGTISGLKAGKTYKITAHISGRGANTSGLATYFIYDYTSNAIVGEKMEFIANSYVYTYSQKPSGISYITPTVDTTVGLRSASAGANYNIGTYTTFTVEEVIDQNSLVAQDDVAGEQITNRKWIDGKQIYRYVADTGGASTILAGGIVDNLLFIGGHSYQSTGAQFPINFYENTINRSFVYKVSSTGSVSHFRGSSIVGAVVILEYTKL
ncbi:beta strand repeat-containing protein [Lutibacter sp.]